VKAIPHEATLGAFISLIRTPTPLDPAFFYLQLSSADVQADIRRRASTTTNISNVSVGELAQVRLRIAPLPEQRRIVAKIEELFTQLDAGVAALRTVQAQLKRYRQAALKHAFDGSLTAEWRAAHKGELEPASVLLERIRAERGRKPSPPLDTSDLPELPEGWVWTTVAHIAMGGEQAVLTGPFGTSLGRRDFRESGVPLLTIGCLTDHGITLDRAKYVSQEKARKLRKYRLRAGDLLFSRMASVGRAGGVDERLEGALFNYHIMRLRLNPQALQPKFYLAYVRGSSAVSDYVREVNHGATRDGINTTQLLRMPVALAPYAEQTEIVSEIERRFSIADEVEKTIDQALKQAERLRQSILKRAFEGRLVPQDPKDEPAEKLLERIKAERAARPKQGRLL
jgi:type I restriction enzyme S subunit